MVVVDGGATHCRVAVVTEDGELLGYGSGGPTNARAIGDEPATSNLVTTIAAALVDGSVDAAAVVYCLVTSASVDTLAHAERFSAAVAVMLPGAVVATLPDTMGCWAATDALGPAVAVISGTGSAVVAADRERSIWRRFGGWDYLLGDEGSGYSLGRAALREALFVSEGRSDARALSDAVLAKAGVDDPEALTDAVHKPAVDKAWIASFAPIVLDAAAAGDAAGRRIVEAETSVLAAATCAGIEALGLDRVVVGMFGGIVRSDVFGAVFTASVRSGTATSVDVVVPEHTALVGAFVIARGWGGLPDDDAVNDRLNAAIATR